MTRGFAGKSEDDIAVALAGAAQGPPHVGGWPVPAKALVLLYLLSTSAASKRVGCLRIVGMKHDNSYPKVIERQR